MKTPDDAKLLELAERMTELLNSVDAPVRSVVSVLMGLAASAILSQVENERQMDQAHELMHNLVCKLFEAHAQVGAMAHTKVAKDDPSAN